MHALAVECHAAGNAGGSSGETRRGVEQGNAGDVVGCQRPGTRGGARQLRGHRGGSERVLQSEGMAELVNRRQEEGVAGTGAVRKVLRKHQQGARDGNKRSIAAGDDCRARDGPAHGNHTRRQFAEHDIHPRRGLDGSRSGQSAELEAQFGRGNLAPCSGRLPDLAQNRGEAVTVGEFLRTLAGHKEVKRAVG